MDSFTMHAAIYLISVFVSSVAQVMLKMSSNKNTGEIIKDLLRPFTMLAFSFFFISTLLTVYAYKGIPLVFGAIFESSGYIYVTALSAIFFKERVTARKAASLLLIVGGIIVFSI